MRCFVGEDKHDVLDWNEDNSDDLKSKPLIDKWLIPTKLRGMRLNSLRIINIHNLFVSLRRIDTNQPFSG